ncbi:helix-turn-helix domain-containing protein [Schlesneria paludicola]|uniref:helix-turn-helix domain-containing protein n=1 Tax=Schlesneria paludicola TaxID=360056 RepID=UPI00030D747F|nr:helix-turn-helix transcriptional regulator [Schlesneria paludicola]
MKLHDRFQKRVHEALEANQMSQGDLAKRLGVSRQNVSQYLCGNRVPGLDMVERFAEALGFAEPNELLQETESHATF